MGIALLSLIDRAIQARIGPATGIVLSGGLDSSTVARLSPRNLPTFTGYYDLPGFDEREYARLVSHPVHHEIRITPQDFVDNFDTMVRHIKPPVQGMGTFGQYMVARYLSEHGIRIALSGEGSDELFGGYARTLLAAGERLPDGYKGYKPPKDYPSNLHDALQYDLDRLPQLLAVDDQMTGAFGIEARAPFTDHAIVDYALALPDTERVGKRHLRQAVRGIVPDRIIDRTDKMGFPAPLAIWAQTEPVRSFVGDRLGYLPDARKPFDRTWWYALVGLDEPAKPRKRAA
jgi:asparagine synthetase B (glutamine-hydrolysing)